MSGGKLFLIIILLFLGISVIYNIHMQTENRNLLFKNNMQKQSGSRKNESNIKYLESIVRYDYLYENIFNAYVVNNDSFIDNITFDLKSINNGIILAWGDKTCNSCVSVICEYINKSKRSKNDIYILLNTKNLRNFKLISTITGIPLHNITVIDKKYPHHANSNDEEVPILTIIKDNTVVSNIPYLINYTTLFEKIITNSDQ